MLFIFSLTYTSSISQDSLSTNNEILGFGIGPQISLTDFNDAMVGPDLEFNFKLKNDFILTADLHAAITTKINLLNAPQYTVIALASVSAMPGYLFYINKKSALLISAGISIGYLKYLGRKYYRSKVSFAADDTYYDEEEIKFIGVPCKVSYVRLKKKTGIELYISSNFHKHPEMAVG